MKMVVVMREKIVAVMMTVSYDDEDSEVMEDGEDGGGDGDVSDDYDKGLKLISDGYCDDDNGDCYINIVRR